MEEGDGEADVPPPEFRVSSLLISAMIEPPQDRSQNPLVVNCLDFHREGRLLVSVEGGTHLALIDAESGKLAKRFAAGKKYPIGLCRFTHHPQAVLCSSRAR